jgi:hypothetical protein
MWGKRGVKMTYKEMCETISQVIKQNSGKDVTPEDIFNADPNGELSHIPILYEMALSYQRK